MPTSTPDTWLTRALARRNAEETGEPETSVARFNSCI
jgi:hypothetical protein